MNGVSLRIEAGITCIKRKTSDYGYQNVVGGTLMIELEGLGILFKSDRTNTPRGG